jgi:crotonobetainyl-CoA:carnitine CoA-transferase CaiB-like acyl-CoA transferase
MAGPLEGYRIIDLTAIAAGPFATMMLADQGADVIKVEPPGIGDVMRFLGTSRGGLSVLWANCNRSKRSIGLNLRDERGREILLDLVAGADVFIQNFRPGVTERLGIDEPALRRVRPDLVYVSISAFGPTGPYAKKPAYDHIIQGIVGAAAAQADPETGRPENIRTIFCDKLTAQVVAQGITAALLARERGKGGQHLRVSMLDAAIAFLWPDCGANETVLEEDANVQPLLSATYRVSEAADGYFVVAGISDAQVHGMFRAFGRPELVTDPRFATAAARMQNMEALLAEFGDERVDLKRSEVLDALEAEDVPCGPVYSNLGEVLSDPQVVASQTFLESRHPQLGRIREPRPPIRFEGTPAAIQRAAPSLGQHTDEVLGELGVSTAALATLRRDGVVC